MTFTPVRIDGGGCMNVIDLSSDGKLAGGADVWGLYLSTDAGDHWKSRQKGAGVGQYWKQCAAIQWSATETATIYALVGNAGDDTSGAFLVGTVTGVDQVTWVKRGTATPHIAGNHGAPPMPTGGHPRSTGRLIYQAGGYLWIGTFDDGIWRSQDNGATWPVKSLQADFAGPQGTGTSRFYCRALYGVPGDASTLYACGYLNDPSGKPAYGRIYKTSNATAATPTWSQLTGSPAQPEDIVILAKNGGGHVLYCAAGGAGMFRSTDGAGSTWSRITATDGSAREFFAANGPNWCTVDGTGDASSTHVIIGGCSDPNQIGPNSVWGCAGVVKATVASPHTGSVTCTYLTGVSDVVQRTTIPPDGRAWWHAGGAYHDWPGGSGFDNPMVVIDRSNTQRVLMCGMDGFYRSLDGGATWTIASNGLPGFQAGGLACSPTEPGHFVFGDSDWTCWDSTTADAYDDNSCSPNPTPAPKVHAHAFSVDGTVVYAGGGDKYSNGSGEVYSRPSGQPNNWTALGLGTLTGGAMAVGLIALNDAGSNKCLIACVIGDNAHGQGGIWRYDPNTTPKWTRVSSVACTGFGTGLPTGTRFETAYAGTGATCYVWDSNVLYRSADYGVTWTAIWTVASNDAAAYSLAVNPNVAGQLWVCHGSTLTRLDGAGSGTVSGGGITVNDAGGGVVAAFAGPGAVTCKSDGTIYVARKDTGSGWQVWQSVNSGVAWTQADDGTFGDAIVRVIQLELASDGRLFAAGTPIVAQGYPGVTVPASSAFTRVQSVSGTGTGNVAARFTTQASTAASLLTMRLICQDATAVWAAPSGWELLADIKSSPGSTGASRSLLWVYRGNPGGLAAPAGGTDQTFSCTNGSLTSRWIMVEFSTPAGTFQYADELGSGFGPPGTSFAAAAGAANRMTAELGLTVIGLAFSATAAGAWATAPAAWSVDQTVSASVNPWRAEYRLNSAGTESIADSYTPATNMTGWSAVLATFWASAVRVTTASVPGGTTGGAYSPQTLAATGGTGPYTWLLTGGTLAPGMVLSSGGVLSGTPTAGGTYAFTALAVDSAGQAGYKQFTLTVSGAVVTGDVAVPVTATIAPWIPATWTGDVAVAVTARVFASVPAVEAVPAGGRPTVADSLVLGGIIELLGGGVPSAHPDCAGAIFRLGRDYDLSAPQLTADVVGGLLLDGEVIASMRASNRHPRLPVVIMVPPTGDLGADRLTLAGARELLLRLAAQENWTLTWTRDGGLPLVLDCQGVSATTIEYSVIAERNLVSAVELEFAAMPYGRSEDPEQILLNAPSQYWDQPPAPVTLDNFNTAPNWLTGDQAGFDVTAGNWAAVTNCTVARSTAQFRTGPAALAVTASAAGNAVTASAAAANWATQMMPVQPGDTVTAGAYSRAATVTRSVSVGAEFYDGSGNSLGTFLGSGVTNTTTGWTTHPVATVTAPGGTVWARAKVQVASAAAAGEVHYFDDVSISRGVWSDVNPSEWVLSAATPLTGQQSAKWARRKGEYPVYDRALGAPTDITGRGKLSLWAGLASTASAYQVWHKGSVSYSVTLTDGNGVTLTFGVKMRGQVSALSSLPHWQHITIPIPQVAEFDFTSVSRYRVEVFNAQDPNAGAPVLQASLFLAGVQAVATSTGAAATRSGWFALPGIAGTARAPLAIQLAPGLSSWATVTEFATAGTKSWTAPAGVSSVDKVECWGAGGGGAASNNDTTGWGGGGGGGGEYSVNRNVPVTALSAYAPVVGAKGTGGTTSTSSNDATGGGDSWFTGNGGNQTTADGGNRGYLSRDNAGGGGGSGSSAYSHHPGGDGFRANHEWDGTGGGGGSAGGTGASGVDAGGQRGASAVTGGGAGGDGGSRVQGQTNAGQNGTAPGGGGGGGGLVLNDSTPRRRGGDGADGKIRLTYGASGMLPLGSFLVHMPQVDAPAAFNPVCTVGNAADSPDGREYTVPQVGALAARFDGTYTVFLIASTWNSPSSSRTLTVTVRQYPYSGAGAITAPVLTRTLTPASDVTNGYVDMGAISLPVADLPPGNSDAYFTVGVVSSNAADRFYDVLFIDSGGQLVLVNMPGTAWVNNAWIDEADRDRDLGRISGSDTDRDRARSLLAWADRVSGGPLSVVPEQDNRLLLYSAQGVPGATAYYSARWWTERLR